jgi:hypothetical protein
MKRTLTCFATLLLGLLLAACGGSPAPTESSPIVSAAGGLGDPAGPAGQQFTIDVSGQLALRLADPAFAARFVQLESAGVPTHQLTFEDLESKISLIVIFLGTTPPAAGTYPITIGAEDNSVYGLLIDRRGEAQGAFTTQDGAGSITLTVDGANYSGSFEFKATGSLQNPDPNAFLTATPTLLDLTVNGTFTNVTLQ